MENQKKFLTEAQYALKQERLDELIHIEIPKNAEEIDLAKAQGDLSENAEYDAAKDQQAKLFKEKSEIEFLLNNAIIIKQNTSNDKVEIGHNVTFEWLDGNFKGKTETINLLGYGNGKDEISFDSPIGKALLGKSVSDKTTVHAPNNRRFQIKVKAIK